MVVLPTGTCKLDGRPSSVNHKAEDEGQQSDDGDWTRMIDLRPRGEGRTRQSHDEGSRCGWQGRGVIGRR
jgi:hypothetical protein